MRNRIYFFTGTGNSLKVAKDLAKELNECEIVAIQKDTDLKIPVDYDRIGFIFPVYYWGMPSMVANFIRNADFSGAKHSYLFMVLTYGGLPANALAQGKRLLQEQSLDLHYGGKVRMVANCVMIYNMSTKVKEITEKAEQESKPVIHDIISKKKNKVPPFSRLINYLYQKSIQNLPKIDEHFNVSDACISCGICRDTCAAKNITLVNGRPEFHHQCETCLSCVQHCPKQAINYDNRTQKRRRYAHPQVTVKELIQYYN